MTTVLSLVLIAFAAGSSARFEAGSDGTVRDTQTGLVWTQKDNGADVDFAGAKAFCEGSTVGGHDDWRLPTIEELQALYDEGVASPPTYLYHGKPYPLRMDPAFQLSAPGVWSSSLRYENRGVAWSFFFSSGRQLSTMPTATNYQRALCVRASGRG
jgi:hypothetical protein